MSVERDTVGPPSLSNTTIEKSKNVNTSERKSSVFKSLCRSSLWESNVVWSMRKYYCLFTGLSDLIRYLKERYIVFLSRYYFSYPTCIGKTNTKLSFSGPCSLQLCSQHYDFIYELGPVYNSYTTRGLISLIGVMCFISRSTQLQEFRIQKKVNFAYDRNVQFEANEPGYKLSSLTQKWSCIHANFCVTIKSRMSENFRK